MIALFSLFIVTSILTLTLLPTAKIVHFFANQESITQEFCENQDKPEMECHGKCHLKKVLKINYQIQNTNTEQFDSHGLFVFQIFENGQSIRIADFNSSQPNNFYFLDLSSEKHAFNLLNPPEILFV
ncbi:MAG: hypothetical protein ABJG99_15450 [Crocinitomicaceae bacterium]